MYIYIYIATLFTVCGNIPKKNGEGNANPLQYSCLENPRDRGAWQATVHGVTEVLDTLSN